jgi:hypothetical protein
MLSRVFLTWVKFPRGWVVGMAAKDRRKRHRVRDSGGVVGGSEEKMRTAAGLVVRKGRGWKKAAGTA